MKDCGQISRRQYCIRRGHSTGDILIYLTPRWAEALENKGEPLAISGDIAKAFNRYSVFKKRPFGQGQEQDKALKKLGVLAPFFCAIRVQIECRRLESSAAGIFQTDNLILGVLEITPQNIFLMFMYNWSAAYKFYLLRY